MLKLSYRQMVDGFRKELDEEGLYGIVHETIVLHESEAPAFAEDLAVRTYEMLAEAVDVEPKGVAFVDVVEPEEEPDEEAEEAEGEAEEAEAEGEEPEAEAEPEAEEEPEIEPDPERQTAMEASFQHR